MSNPVRRVAFLAPMPSELGPLVRLLGLSREGQRGAGTFRGTATGVELVAARTGVGMDAAAACTRRVLDTLSPDHLIVVGIAGGIGASVAVGDVVVPDRVLNLGTGESLRPTPIGSREPRGTLASSDTLLESPEEARALANRGVIAIDMETAAIGGECDRRGCPWSVFRAISDRADDGSTDAALLGLLDPDGRAKLRAVAGFVLGRPDRIPQLVRLARGAGTAARVAARAAVRGLASLAD